jgi:ATP-dependent helicase/nuclease subunit A
MNSVRKFSWYDLIVKGLEQSGLHLREIKTPDGVVKRYSRIGDFTAAADAAGAAPVPPASTALPAWLHETAPLETHADHPLRPSDPAEDEGHRVRAGESPEMRARALLRGTLVHRLLQSLPDIGIARRRDAALGYLARNAGHWSADDREALAAGVLALIEDPAYAAVFAAGSRAEVSIVGRLDRPGRPPALVSGQIDRLVVTPAEVLIVDYKTNHAPPRLPAEAPAAYVRQLALYRAVLRKLYPSLPVRAALLWTETPDLMEISTAALDAALPIPIISA